MFDPERFIADCQQAMAETEPRLAIRDVLDAALREPTSIGDVLRPDKGGVTLLHHTPELTVIHAVWPPGIQLFPHNHNMWAAIAVYAGREDNEFFRRTPAGASTITGTAGGRQLAAGDVLLLGDDVIHSVANSTSGVTAAIHVYDGDFVQHPRSAWGPGPRKERPHDMQELAKVFADANALWKEQEQP